METTHNSERTGKTGRILTVYWLPVGLWMGIIFVMSARQSISVSEVYLLNFLFFKFLHIIEYVTLYVLLLRAVAKTYTSPARVNAYYIAAFVLTILYAITDEMHQTAVPSREGTARDVIIDAIGAGSIWILLRYWLPQAPAKLRRLAKRLDIPS